MLNIQQPDATAHLPADIVDLHPPLDHGRIFDNSAAVVHRLAVAGGLRGLSASTWRLYQRYRVASSMELQYRRSRHAAGGTRLAETKADNAWIMLSRYTFDALWEERTTLRDVPGQLPLSAILSTFCGAYPGLSVDDVPLLPMLVDAELVEPEALDAPSLAPLYSPSSLTRLAETPEAALTLFAASMMALPLHSPAGDYFHRQLLQGLGLPGALVENLRIRLGSRPELPLAS